MSGSSGKEIAGEEEGEGEEPRTLVVRARDGDWIMGDDLVLVVTGEETVVEIQEVHVFCAVFCSRTYEYTHTRFLTMKYHAPTSPVSCQALGNTLRVLYRGWFVLLLGDLGDKPTVRRVQKHSLRMSHHNKIWIRSLGIGRCSYTSCLVRQRQPQMYVSGEVASCLSICCGLVTHPSVCLVAA